MVVLPFVSARLYNSADVFRRIVLVLVVILDRRTFENEDRFAEDEDDS